MTTKTPEPKTPEPKTAEANPAGPLGSPYSINEPQTLEQANAAAEAFAKAKEAGPQPATQPGSSVRPNVPSGGGSGPPLDLTDLEPDSIVVGSTAGFELTLTGTGFTGDCVVVLDDEEQQTTYVSDTKLTAWVAVADKPATVDVEVARGEDLSDVLTFEFTQAPRSRKQPERKPKKSTPSHKRLKKGRSR